MVGKISLEGEFVNILGTTQQNYFYFFFPLLKTNHDRLNKKRISRSSCCGAQVKDPALSLQQLRLRLRFGFDPWLGTAG